MRFGKLSQKELDGLDLSLPPDHPGTTKLLADRKKEDSPGVYVGCAKWGRKEWVGQIYPEGTKDKDFLSEYVKHFNSIEINASFYNAKRTNFEKWAEEGVEGFKFCPKVTRLISHIKRLNNAEEITDYFLDAIQIFGDNLGLSFLQLPENFSPGKFEVFQNFIEYLPDDTPLSIELRHPEWFSDEVVSNETYDLLQSNNISLVITDVAGRRDCLHQRLTTPETFIRFNGYDLHPSDYSRMDEWALKIKDWLDAGLKSCYFFMHQEDEKNTPISADYMIKKLNEVCDLDLKRPDFIEESK